MSMIMKKSTKLTAFVLGFSCLGSAALADTAAESVQVDDPYVRAVPPGLTNSASYMSLINTSDQTYALVSVETSAARIAELHEHVHEDGMMMMREVAAIEIPAQGRAVLQPGGLHVMLIGLNRDLKPGESLPIVLQFKDGSRKEVQAPVRKIMTKMQKPMH